MMGLLIKISGLKGGLAGSGLGVLGGSVLGGAGGATLGGAGGGAAGLLGGGATGFGAQKGLQRLFPKEKASANHQLGENVPILANVRRSSQDFHKKKECHYFK